MTPLWFLSSLVIVYGELTIDIDISEKPPIVDFRGFLPKNIVSDQERNSFKINEDQLKNAVAEYTNQIPNYVYVKKTKEENDLYAKYEDWMEVERTVKPRFDLDLKPAVCMDVYGKADIIKEQNVFIDIESRWEKKEELSVYDNLTYNVYYDNDDDGTSSVSVSSKWGKDVFYFRRGLGNFTKTDYKVMMCRLNVVLEYEASLSGDVAVDNTKKRNDHHYWAYDLRNIQAAAGLPTSVVVKNNVTITYFDITRTTEAKEKKVPNGKEL